jgi:AI-2 transport protein TqsA
MPAGVFFKGNGVDPSMSTDAGESRIQTLCLIILATFAVVVGLYWLRPMVVPFVWALFFSIALTPLINLLVRRLRFPRGLAIAVTIVLFFAAVIVLGGLVASSIKDFATNAHQYEGSIEHLVEKATSSGLLQRFGIELPKEADLLSVLPQGTLKGVVVNATNAMMSLLSRGTLVALFVIFLLVGGRTEPEPEEGIVHQMESGTKTYIATKVFVSGVTGFLVFATLWVLGVPFAITFGAFAFILNFIPTFGSVISTLMPLPVLLFTPGLSTTTVVLAIAIPGVIQLAVGNAVEPKLMGRSLDLHPITILLALIFWGMIWGFEGMILGVPITAVVKIILEKAEMTAPVANLMAGRRESARADC